MAREADVIGALVGLADSLVADYDPLELLQQLVDDCMRLLDVSAVGLLLAGHSHYSRRGGQGGRLQVAAASSEQIRTLEVIQLHGDQGPCLEAFDSGERVVAGDPAEIERCWADFAADVSAAGFRSVAAVPLRLREQRIGALGLFSDRDHVPEGDDIAVAQAFADIATITILHQQAVHDSAQVTAQLQRALDSRVLIEQAKGVIATQLGVSITDAFSILRDHARTRGAKLTQVAGAVVAGELNAQHLHTRPARSDSRRSR
ncbi:GAF and ANTAR domain-containing protein [Kineococcus endophyticus]|uniref:GAF and ANTAR domain-containing protein n=1 Tax=Kineococcus endophyticus TaxID=1181883 RepID=A0ABV3PEJ4_9ACTN